MASDKNLRRTAAQMGYSHRGLNRWMLKIRKSSEEMERALESAKRKKTGS